mgnify:CR=1 FL=1|jgi:very-short-patch-repair endonuclease
MTFKKYILPYDPKLKSLALKLRKRLTFSEAILWNELKQKKTGFNFSRQRPIDHYIVDFYAKELKLAIEIDGENHRHISTDKRDALRQKNLEKLGVRFLRFDDLYIKQNLNEVLMTLHYWIDEHKNDLGEKKPTPSPSQEGNSLELEKQG